MTTVPNRMRAYREDGSAAARRQQRGHLKRNDHQSARDLRREADRRERKHRAQWLVEATA